MSHSDLTLDAGSLGTIRLVLDAGTRVTPASRITLEAISSEQHRLSGRIIDWGSGSGALAIAAARAPGVTGVLGLEVDAAAAEVARRNIETNGVAGVVTVVHADSFRPIDPADATLVEAWVGGSGGLVANPPGSVGDDGLGWRRRILRDGRRFLAPGATVLLQISYQYSADRIARLTEEVPGFAHEGVVASSGWVPFDQTRADLAALLRGFAAEEERGGIPYTFADTSDPDTGDITATQALERLEAKGTQPLTRWQVHCFTFLDPEADRPH